MTRQFPRIFFWHVVRDLRRHRLLAALNLGSVALGLAVHLAIRIATESANSSFAAGIDLVAGKAELEVRGAVSDEVLPRLIAAPEVKAATPIVEGIVTLPDRPDEYLRIVGVDIFTNEPFRTFPLAPTAGELDLESWLGAPAQIALSKSFAEKHGLASGQSVRALVNGVIHELRVLFLVDLNDTPAAANPRVAFMDLGWAQELFSTPGKLSSIQLLLSPRTEASSAMKSLGAILPTGATIAPPGQRSLQIGKMLGAFEMNLTALSMIATLVGVFLIYNTISASVVRRRSEIGMLRALGASRLEVRALFLGEALLFGLGGVVLGSVGGVVLARALSGSVAETISSLYILVSIDRTRLVPWQFVVAALLALGSVIVAAWRPANEAARSDPIRALQSSASFQLADPPRTQAGSLRYFAALVLALICSWLALHTSWPWLGFVSAFLVLLGFALLAPPVIQCAGNLWSRFASAHVLLRLAADNVRRSLPRNSITVASLSAAVAMMIGISVMIFAFRNTVDAWIGRGIVADLFIAPASNEVIGLSAFVPPEAVEYLRGLPEVAAVDTFREVTTTFGDQPISVAAIEGADRRNLRFVGGGEREKMRAFFAGEGVLVTESFAQKFHVRDGDALSLATPHGPAELRVLGVYYDYTRDRGVVTMDRRNFDRWWSEPGVQSLALYLRPGADAEHVAAAFRAQFSREGEFSIYSNRTLRTRILDVFDQTFAVTYVLRLIAIIVAVIGIFLSVTALVSERAREIGVLRALGGTAAQVRRLFVLEAAFLGLVAGLLGLASGACLALVLTWVINKAFFGWTIILEWPWALLVTTPLWITAAAAAAAWWPARQAARANIAGALRFE